MSKKNQKHEVAAADVTSEVVAEQPKIAPTAVQAEPKAPKNTPVFDRIYKLKAAPSLPPKGKQRQIVLQILQEAQGEPLGTLEIAKRASEKGLQAVGGVPKSCKYHLHHLAKLGIAELVNPTITMAENEQAA